MYLKQGKYTTSENLKKEKDFACKMTKTVIMSFWNDKNKENVILKPQKVFKRRDTIMKEKKPVFDTTLPKNIPLLMKLRARDNVKREMQLYRDKSGKLTAINYDEVYRNILAAAAAFRMLGVKRGSNVGIISDNRKEWLWSDLAILSLGAADVPRGCDSLSDDISYILNFSECETAVFENETQLLKILDRKDKPQHLKNAILFDVEEGKEFPVNPKTVEKAGNAGIELYAFQAFIEKGRELLNEDPHLRSVIEDEMEQTSPDETATIIYTSGTTGVPKGVMISHRNLVSELECIPSLFPAKPGDRWLSVLPVWHSFERFIQYAIITFSDCIAYSKPVGQIMLKDMAEVHPLFMCGVPRLWESVAKGVFHAMKKQGGITYAMFRFFVRIGRHYSVIRDMVTGCVSRFRRRSRVLDFLVAIIPFCLLLPLYALGDLLVFRKLRQKFGGCFTAGISGGGSLPIDIERFYRACRINLLEGYGMTETSPIISFRNYEKSRPGCVGTIFPSVEARVVKEEHGVIQSMEPLPPGQKGMILVKSEQVMKGYYKQPELTATVIDKDGWLNTGDLGLFTYDGEIKITGRAKDTIVLYGGENVEPSPIESAICESSFVETAVVMGQDKKGLVALIVPDKTSVEKYASEKHLSYAEYPELLKKTEIIDLFFAEIKKKISLENGFRAFERIFNFSLLPESFKVGEELSIKMEVSRFKVEEKYRDELQKLYDKIA